MHLRDSACAQESYNNYWGVVRNFCNTGPGGYREFENHEYFYHCSLKNLAETPLSNSDYKRVVACEGPTDAAAESVSSPSPAWSSMNVEISEHQLTATQAATYSLALTIAYVGCLYVSSKTRPSETQRRDDPRVVYSRMNIILILTSVMVLLVVPGIFIFHGVYSRWIYALRSLGIALGLYELIIAPVVALMVTAILYIGPLYNYIVFENELRWREIWRDIKEDVCSLHGIRNYIVGPLTEELIFRSCILAIYLSTNSSTAVMVFATPLYFAVAHLHHFYENWLHDRNHLKRVLLVSLLQFAYTTVFGWYVSFIFLQTASVWACIAVHVFCNSMGLPPLGLDTRKKTLFYRILLFIGICGFITALPWLGRSNELRRWFHP